MKRRSGRYSGAIALAGALLFAPAGARADVAAQARFHDELAREHYEAKRFEQAVREFFLEQRLAPNPRISFNIALCFEQLDRPDDAYMYFDEYLAAAEQDEGRRKYATAARERLEPRVARIFVTSTPPGARIFVNEREHGEYGVTPRTVALEPGDHRVWVELDGYRKAEVRVEARLGKRVEAKLEPERILGKLEVTAPVSGEAEVRAPDGTTLARHALPLTLDLPPGPYEVVVRAPGHVDWKEAVTVREDATVAERAVPRALPPPTGDMTVTANLAGALVELDGEAAGFTPTVLGKVTTGKHRLKLTGASVVPWEGDVHVRADERSWVTVSLEDPPTTRRSSATWVVGGLGAVALVSAGVVGFMAVNAHEEFASAPANSDRSDAASRGRTLNTVADALLVGGVVATGLGVALYFGTAETTGRPSSATVAQGGR